MTVVKARIPVGRTYFERDVELYTVQEAKEILVHKDWEIGGDIYSTEITNKRIGWLAQFENGDGIYVEASR